MKHNVKFCPNNFTNELQDVKSDLKLLPNVNVIEDDCLNYCGQCLVEPFAMINGKNSSSDDVTALYQNITEYLETLETDNSNPKPSKKCSSYV